MENNGLAFAAPASYALPDGLAMKDTSNHFAAQQMDFSDTANMFATPVQTSVDRGVETSAQESYDSTTLSIAKEEEKHQPKDEGMKVQIDPETGSASAANMEELQREGDQHDYSTLDTPARPKVDHGIESSVRDTLDMSVPEPGLFKVESAPQSGLETLDLYDGLPVNGEGQEIENMADPSTPSIAQDAFTASPPVVEEEPSLHQAYAMLKFPDSYFYVKSTNVMITRDETFRRAYHEAKKQKRLMAKMQRAAQQSLDDYAREPSHHSQYGGDDEEDMIGRPARGLLSTYSDVGGAVSYNGQENGGMDPAAFVHHSRKNKHNSSSNHSIAPRSLHEFEHGDELEGDLYLDKEGRTHDPHEWTQVAIHPQRPEDIDKISREHLIIRYDGDKRSWVMDVIGNRVLHNGQLRNRGESDIDLSHEDEIIIISVSFKFMLPADEDPDVMESVEWDDDLETSPAARRMTDTIDDIESDMDDDSSEEDVPLAQQAKPKKVKAKKTKKTKEPKPKREPVKLKLKNKKAEVQAQSADPEDKKEKQKGKAPAKSGGKTGGKVPAKAVKSTPKEADPTPQQPVPQTEPEAAKPAAEQQPVPSTEAQLVEFAQSGQAPQQGPPTQASPPAPINLDPNSAFAGADPSQLPQKRKGPGRPPKNGLISKRDDAGVKRKIKEYERANMAIPPMNELLELVRVEQRQKDAAAKAASRGEAAPDAGMQNIDPRMQSYSVPYTSAAPSQPPQSLPAGTDSPHDLPQAAARSTSPRPRRPAKSPSPMPPQETFSEDQLKKPTITYVFIIDEILQDPALDGQADLQTIYDKIQKRWPYYKYGTTTNGWQSSVRHNLLQCPRFVESGKSGKGKYWKINFEHELDPKKRKQATPPPQGPSRSGPPYQQPYNASYAQGGSMYNAPFNQNAYPAAGPSGTAQPSQQQHPPYGSQPPNGNRMPSQQPPAVQSQPQPFATIVQAIVAYRTEYLQPHVGKDTHSGAEAQFNQALNHYSEVHAGHTPATEGKIDESQDPFRSMKQIFIDFGQGDTRATQNGTNPAPAAGAAPTAVPGPANPNLSSTPATSSSPATASNPAPASGPAPAAVTSAASTSTPGTAPATTSATPSQPVQPMASAPPRPAAPISNSNTSTPPMHIQQVQPPPAMSNLPPKPQVSAPSQTQAPTTRPVAAANMQTTSTSSVVGTGLQSRAPTAPMQKQATVARPITAASVQNPGAAAATSTAPQSQASHAPAQMQTSATRPIVTPPQATGPAPASRPVNPATQVPASRPIGTAQAASMMPTSQSPAAAPSTPSSHVAQQQMGQNSAPVARAPVAPRPQQPPQVSGTQTAAHPAQQQPRQAVVSSTPQPPLQTQRQPMQQPTSNVAGANTRPQQPVAATNGTVPLAQRVPTSQPQQKISPVQKVAPSGLNGGTSASLPTQVPRAPLPDQQTAKQEPQADVRPSSAGVKRPAEETSEDQASKRARTSSVTQPASQSALPEARSDTLPASTGVKRNADGDNDDSGAKRLKV